MRKEELKNLLLSLKEEDYWTKADLHIHSNESDGILNPIEIVEQAKKKGLEYIAITDHNTIDAYLSTNVLRESIMIPAVEFDCYYKGNLIHILGYGINIDNQELKPLFAENKLGKTLNLYRIFKLRNTKEVIEKIKNAGGIAVLAHPCCYWTLDFDAFVRDLIELGLEGIEAYYPYNGLRKVVKFHSKDTIKGIANKYNLIKTGGTDSHKKTLL